MTTYFYNNSVILHNFFRLQRPIVDEIIHLCYRNKNFHNEVYITILLPVANYMPVQYDKHTDICYLATRITSTLAVWLNFWTTHENVFIFCAYVWILFCNFDYYNRNYFSYNPMEFPSSIYEPGYIFFNLFKQTQYLK